MRSTGTIKEHLLDEELAVEFTGSEAAMIVLFINTKKGLIESGSSIIASIQKNLGRLVLERDKTHQVVIKRGDLNFIYNTFLRYGDLSSYVIYTLMAKIRKLAYEGLTPSDIEKPHFQPGDINPKPKILN